MSVSYWSVMVEAEQLRDDNVAYAQLLLQKYGYAVTEVTGSAGTFLLYEQQQAARLVRGFVRPGQWVHVSSTRTGETLVKVKDGPPAGPRVAP